MLGNAPVLWNHVACCMVNMEHSIPIFIISSISGAQYINSGNAWSGYSYMVGNVKV